MNTIDIETTEPIKITCHPIPGAWLVKVDGIPYCVIDGNLPDLIWVREYVENTYFDGDHMSTMYFPPRVKLNP